MVDTILKGKTRTRRRFCAFYTDSDPIVTYMTSRLEVADGDHILEPCAGDGVFVQKLLEEASKNKVHIDCLDNNPEAIATLKRQFRTTAVSIREADTLLDADLDLIAMAHGKYTKVIGNPPYGAWQDMQRRQLLKKRYGGYVRETYTLFVRRCLDVLKDGGRLVFIIPDTFLALHLHIDTRRVLLENTKMEEVLLIPSHFFPGVSFGYANLCVLTVVKSKPLKRDKIRFVAVSDDINALYQLATGDYSAAQSDECVPQSEVLTSDELAFLIGGTSKARKVIKTCSMTIGDMADCVTGFYSGDNRAYLAVVDPTLRGAKGYRVIERKDLNKNLKRQSDILGGVAAGGRYIPILKGAGGRVLKDSQWYVRWDKEAIAEYKSSRAARFQNSQYYFREGIGVPMVRSSRLRAFLLEHRLFDQSIVGIFPRDAEYLEYLLGFLNSRVCTALLDAINHTANNSANYIKRLPIVVEKAAIAEINNAVEEFTVTRDEKECVRRFDEVFDALYDV